MEENSAKMRDTENSKKYACLDVHFSFGEEQILETRCIKQRVFWVDPLRDFFGVSNAHTLMFF